MKLRQEMFKPCQGILHGHLFENPLAGLKRDLYWGIEFDFLPFEFEGEEEEPNCMVEWLTFPQPNDVFKKNLIVSNESNSDGEASCYFQGMHIEIEEWKLELVHSDEKNTWHLVYELSMDYLAENSDVPTKLKISNETVLAFGGFIVVKDSFPSPINSKKDAMSLLSDHIEVDEVYQCHDEGFKFVIK